MKFELETQVLVSTISFLAGNTVPTNKTEVRIESFSGPMELVGNFGNDIRPYDWKTFILNPPKIVKSLTVQQTDGEDLRILFIEIFT